MILFFGDGRLGNQIFQYVFLNTVAKENEIIVSTDMNQFSNTFIFDNPRFKQIRLNRYMNFIFRKIIKKYLLNFLVKIKIIGYIQQNRNEASALPTLTIKKGLFPITLVESNFFQSEIFFDDKIIDFKIKESYLKQAKLILKSLPEEYTKVFVHVRRGDYIFEKYLEKQGIDLPKSYFLDAIEMMLSEIKNPYFIFLSDDPTFCQCCFEEVENKYVSSNIMEVDLALMSLCEYGIVSNSSFSWWGAYLMNNRRKVISPKYWYGWKQKIESHIGIQPEWATVIEVFNHER